MKATREGKTAVVKELVDAGADINARNRDGNNALWFACFGNHYELMNLLVAASMDLENKNDNGAAVIRSLSRQDTSREIALKIRAKSAFYKSRRL